MSVSTTADWHNVSEDEPCPKCEKTDWCSIANDGSAVFCARVPNAAGKTDKAGKHLHRLKSIAKRDKKSHPFCQKVDTYHYKDIAGNILYSKDRYEPGFDGKRKKDFAYWHMATDKDTKKKNRSNKLPTERVPYRLRLMLEQAERKPHQSIFVVEGEKAVNYCRRYGLNATCFVSTGEYRSEFDQYFTSRKIVFVLDNDAAGEKALSAAAQVNRVAESVKVVKLPNAQKKWGLDDWIAANKGAWKQPFRDLVQNAKPFEPSPKQAEAVEQKRKAASLQDRKLTNHTKFADGESVPLSLADITGKLSSIITGDWPKVSAGRLFHYDEAEDRIRTLGKPAQLFAWIGQQTGVPPEFCRTPDCHGREEFFEHLIETQEHFNTIELLPHEPQLCESFYAHREIPETNGQHFDWLLNRFSVASEIDRVLIASLFLTVAWGGPAGERPIFLVTADGHGAGKTTLAKVIAALFGGAIDVQPTEKLKELKERLLSPEGRKSRLALIDNMKGFRISNAELEALITSSRISGREMYVGEGSRPNLLTWMMTSNSPGLSRDLAQRVVNIQLKRSTYSASWASDTFAYVAEHRWEIIADVIGLLRSPRGNLERYSRWSKWEGDILSRLPDASAVQKLIADRQAELDCDGEESEDIEMFIRSKLNDLRYSADDSVFIPSIVMAKWYAEVTGERCSTTKATRSMKRNIKDGLTTRLSQSRTSQRRGFIWLGEGLDEPRTDLEIRLSHQFQ